MSADYGMWVREQGSGLKAQGSGKIFDVLDSKVVA